MTDQKEPEALPAKLFAALAKAQAEFPAIPKNRTGRIRPKDQSKQGYEFKYADLEAIIAATRPALTAHGISVIQVVRDARLVTILAHESGESIESSLPLGNPGQNVDLKVYGSDMSYLRRYGYQSMVCVASDDDLDAEGEGDGAGNSQQRPAQQPQRPHYSDEQFDANFPQWKKLIEGSKRTHDEIIATVESKAPMTDKQKKTIREIKQGANPAKQEQTA